MKFEKIDPLNKIIYFKNSYKENYDKLISSIPLPEIVNIIENTPKEIIEKSKLLKWTSGYTVSIGLSTKEILPYLWFYIYDEDIPFARVYSPSHKSKDNFQKVVLLYNWRFILSIIIYLNNQKKKF